MGITISQEREKGTGGEPELYDEGEVQGTMLASIVASSADSISCVRRITPEA